MHLRGDMLAVYYRCEMITAPLCRFWVVFLVALLGQEIGILSWLEPVTCLCFWLICMISA